MDWSPGRKTALIVFALVMTYLHSLYILGFYVSEDEYWWPVWTGMTAGERLLSYALALFANLGLMVAPFWRAPGKTARWVLAFSLASGLVISVSWLIRDIWNYGLLYMGPLPTIEHLGLFLADLIYFTFPPLFRVFFTIAVFSNLWFLFNLVKPFEKTGEGSSGR